MGVGFKLGGGGYFRAELQVTANPGAVVTITCDTATQQKTADANGLAVFIIRRKGTYTVETDFGFSGTVAIVAYTTYTYDAQFSVNVTVQANPSATVTLTNYTDSSITYSGTANSTTGLVTIAVKKAGQYSVSSNNAGEYSCTGNTNSVNVTQGTGAVSIQFVKMNIAALLNLGNYSHQTVLAYWARPSSNWSGVNIRYSTGSAPASRTSGTNVYTGQGSNYALNYDNQNLNGCTQNNLTAGTTYYFSMFNYLTINGTNYWSEAYRTASIVPISTIGTVETITSSGMFTIPTGWRQIAFFLVGGGAGGSVNGNPYAGSGGGGGYVVGTSGVDVLPGQQHSAIVGAGGSSGNRGGTTSFFTWDAVGGYSGYDYNYGSYVASHGGNGASGGGAGANRTGYAAGAGGSDGSDGNGASTTYGGTGQHFTTKAFGETAGVVYSGGGGGGEYYSGGAGAGGTGGGGAGGSNGSYRSANGYNATANTGGGGGGTGYAGALGATGGWGGSGVILVKCVA